MKTKFDPKDVPKWCKWIAVDKNGVCAVFKIKPTPVEMTSGGFWSTGDDEEGVNCMDLYKGNPPRNWKTELYTWS